jgi:Ser/Thr protein kinase RdoA (MazF antagonist)
MILRLGYPDWRTFEDLKAEALWLSALARDTDIGAPKVIPSKGGELVLPVSSSNVPGTWHATLMSWVEGRSLMHWLTPLNMERIGELFAKLHIHGSQWQPPSNFTQRRFDRYMSRGEPDELFNDQVLSGLSEIQRYTLLNARNRVESEYRSLDSSDMRVIHCDLWHENIKIHKGRLHPFDFEDTVWGYRLHDLAMGMLDLLETVGNDGYPYLLQSVKTGYERLLRWPEGSMEALQMGRMLWVLNWKARFAPGTLAGAVESSCRTFAEFGTSGRLILYRDSD